jgi:hypothetical protein
MDAVVQRLCIFHCPVVLDEIPGDKNNVSLLAFRHSGFDPRRGRQCRLHLVPHVNAPVSDLPVRKFIAGNYI